MAIGDDFSVAANGDIRHVSGTTRYTVLQLHRWLGDKSDDPTASGDDVLDVTTDVTAAPSTRNFDTIIVLNGSYNIDDTASQYFYGGSITQDGGDTVYSGLRVIGSVNNSSTELQIVQNNSLLTAFWGDQSSGGFNGDADSGVLMRCLIKTRSGGTDIDGKRIRVQARHWGDTYDFFNVTLGVGEETASIQTVEDGQNDTSQGTVTAYTHVTNTEGYQTIDLNNGNGAQPYYSQWTYGADTSGDGLKGLYEFTKDLVGTGTAKTIHGINGELFLGITHYFAYDNESGGPFSEDEVLSWGTGATAGTGLLLALDDDGATGNMYIQLLTGVSPADDLTITGGTSSATCDVNGTVTRPTVPKVFLGSYTGSLQGGFGIGVDNGDVAVTDELRDLTNTVQSPPNNVTVSVSGVVSSEDYILIGRDDGAGDLEKDTYSLAAGNTSGNGTVVVKESIASDEPSSGFVRVYNATTTSYDKYAYTSWSGSTFTLSGTLSQTYIEDDNVFVPIIDQVAAASSVSNTLVFSSGFSIVGTVRDGGVTPIIPFPITGTVTSTGFSVSAVRQADV